MVLFVMFTIVYVFFLFKQKTAYEMRISDWSSDVCSSDLLLRNLPVKALTLADGSTAHVTTVFDLFCANYGVDRGFGGENVAKSYDDDVPFTPAWAEKVTGVPRQAIIQVAREFADTAEKTSGRSMVILGAGLNHWYHMDMSYREIGQGCDCTCRSGGSPDN